MRIRFLTVGGTIDKVYFDKLSQYEVGPPGVERILRELPVAFEYEVQSLLRKDSLDMDDADRQLVVQAVRRSPERLIVITHGTDTMIETARLLVGIPDRRVVLTGAMQPANFHNTDAIFNIGQAIGVLMAGSEDGVFLAMSGRVFDPRRARKNRDKGVFEDLDAISPNSARNP
ncbi:MAG: asparaginase domain-containing protein [Planctomyces sp.]|jgi:L-asparaginase